MGAGALNDTARQDSKHDTGGARVPPTRPPAGRRDSWKTVSMFHAEHYVDDIVRTNVPRGTFVVAVLYVYKCTRIDCKGRQRGGLGRFGGLRGRGKQSQDSTKLAARRDAHRLFEETSRLSPDSPPIPLFPGPQSISSARLHAPVGYLSA